MSESHPDWGSVLRKSNTFTGDVGGDFYSRKQYIRIVYPDIQSADGKYVDTSWFPPRTTFGKYRGQILATHPSGLRFPDPPMVNLGPLGSTAIARCKPTNNVADVSVFLAELYSDGLPKLFGATLWKENVNLAKSSGEEYLNKEFGWDPMIGDVKSISSAIMNADTVLRQYERNSGSIVRRRYEFPEEKTESPPVLVSANAAPVTMPDIIGIYYTGDGWSAKLYKITRTYTRRWFSGAFTYHLPSDYHSRWALERFGAKARTLLGLDLTPEVLWEAAPWSWAIDWFSNAGDVISNLSDWSNDGLVLKWGYMMEHSFITETYFLDGLGTFRTKGIHASPVIVCVETKRRQRATPFGFSLDWSGFSPRQWAITAALGLTRR